MIQAQNIHKIYDQQASSLHVLKGIDLNVMAGEALGVVGPSGAGKSTLLHILGGLDAPDEGRVILDDEDLYQLNDDQLSLVRNQKIGFIFQFYHLLPEFTAIENVMLPALVMTARPQAELKEEGLKLLDRVGLKQRCEHKPSQLSGGEQQRVAIARALINKPKIVYCDEPTGNLDSESGRGVIDLLLEVNQDNRQTLIIVTHDEEIAKRCHRVVQMRDGEIAD